MLTSKRFFSRWILLLLVVACCTGLGCKTQPPSTTDPSATSADPSSSSSTSPGGVTLPGGSTTSPDGSQVTGLDGEGTGGENTGSIQGINLVNAPNETLTYGEQITAAAWDENDKQNTTAILNSLPESFRRCTPSIRLASTISAPDAPEIWGLCDPTSRVVTIAKSSPDFKGTLVHEMAHSWHFQNPNGLEEWKAQFWNGNAPKSSSVPPGYGNTNAMEDLAESVREYYTNGAGMRNSHPDRYEFVKTKIMGGKEY